MTIRPKYRDFSEMPADALCALARDLANPKEALRRIRKERRERSAGFQALHHGERDPKGLAADR